jgi:hypothetical protein
MEADWYIARLILLADIGVPQIYQYRRMCLPICNFWNCEDSRFIYIYFEYRPIIFYSLILVSAPKIHYQSGSNYYQLILFLKHLHLLKAWCGIATKLTCIWFRITYLSYPNLNQKHQIPCYLCCHTLEKSDLGHFCLQYEQGVKSIGGHTFLLWLN